MGMIRVLCVEDDPIMRRFLAERLEAEPGIQMVSAVSDLPRALLYLRPGEVDIVLLDYQLHGVEGTQLLETMFPWYRGAGACDQNPAVLFCTGFADEAFEAKARLLGARGVVAKEAVARDLIPALCAVASGGLWFHHEVHAEP